MFCSTGQTVEGWDRSNSDVPDSPTNTTNGSQPIMMTEDLNDDGEIRRRIPDHMLNETLLHSIFLIWARLPVDERNEDRLREEVQARIDTCLGRFPDFLKNVQGESGDGTF